MSLYSGEQKKIVLLSVLSDFEKNFTITYFYNYSALFKFSVRNIDLLNMFHSVVFITVKSPDRVRGRAAGTKRLSPFFNGISPPSYAAVA